MRSNLESWIEEPHRFLHDGRMLVLMPLLFGWRLVVVPDPTLAAGTEVYEFPFAADLTAIVAGTLREISPRPMVDDADARLVRELWRAVLDDAGTRAALRALHCWDGSGDPEGWYRHKPSNRRRPDGDPSREEVRP